jgi:hypothetical protein
MARGGKRSGSGRPPGAVNKLTAETRQAAIKSGQTPLDYMLEVMRDTSVEHKRRDRMAVAAASYLHAKVQPAAPVIAQKPVVATLNFPVEVLQRMRLENQQMLRGQVISPQLRAAIDNAPPIELEDVPKPDQTNSGGEQREEAKRPSGPIFASSKKHWSV